MVRSSKLPEKTLGDLRVVDLSMGWAGPLAAMLLGDFGAEVIKIESIHHLDWWRGAASLNGDGDRPYEKVATFNGVNRNKFECALDLNDPRGKDLIKRLISISDVLIENFTPRVMGNFGLTYGEVSRLNPSLVMISMPGFGSTGPWRDYAGFGNTLECLSGVTSLTGYPDGPPILCSNAYGDPVSGMGGAIAVLMALIHRLKTGRGQHVELAHQELIVHHVTQTLMDYAMNGRDHGRQGNRHPSNAPHGIYRCFGEDEWIAISVSSDTEWASLCRSLDRTDLMEIQNFADCLSRWHHQDELDILINGFTIGWKKSDLSDKLQNAGVPAAPVNSNAEVLKDPHFRDPGSFVWIDRRYVGNHPYPGITAKLSATPGAVYKPAPTLGEDNYRVLGDLLALGTHDIQSLEREGVIGDTAVP